MRSIFEIIEDIKKYKGISDDVELAKLLEVRANTVSTWKSRNTIPYKKLVAFCDVENLNINDVLNCEMQMWGKKGLHINQEMPGMIHESPEAYSDERLDKLITRVKKIYKDGDLSECAAIRGMIDEVYERLIRKIDDRLKAAAEPALKKTNNAG